MNQIGTRVVALLVACVAGCGPAPSQILPDEGGEDDPPPQAASLLSNVVARLPRETLRIRGDIKVRKRKGVELRHLTFHALLDLGRQPALVQYTVMDAFGQDLERLTVIRREGAQPEFMYASGDPLAPAPPPPLSQSIQDTDICWMDLTLSFLWWPGGTLVDEEETRGRPCYVVEVDNPHAGDPAHDRLSYSTQARLWIDQKMHMLLQAELLNANHATVRRLWVKSFKKIDDRWMIKEMEVEGTSAVHRTRLTILDVNADTP